MDEETERESNRAFTRGLRAGQDKAKKDSSSSTSSISTPTINLPKTNDDQDLTLNLIIILGLVLVMISAWGGWLEGIIREITTAHQFTLNFNPFAQGKTTFNNAATGGSSSNTGSNSAVGHYTVDLAGGGQMTVNASSQQAAVENVKAEGGTPA